MRFFAAALIFFGAASYGQAPEVPHKMRFAGMTLTIRDDARKEIQKDVDALAQRSRYYTMKVERAKTYFPIIEKIFEEENIPDDFKYLVLQESALVADAVSVSNAVGYWQFLDFTAASMGMRVDKHVDERMNIVSATRGAARFLNQNNKTLDNWLSTLQSYQMGLGGARKALGETDIGVSHMDITGDTYWYVKKYLAHKIAFENALEGEPVVKLALLEIQSGKSLAEIAKEVSVDEEKLRAYNKWSRTGEIPGDKTYIVLVPTGDLTDFTKLTLSKASPLDQTRTRQNDIALSISEINGIPVVRATSGATLASLAAKGDISLKAFLRYNEISANHQPKSGSSYFLKKKKKQAEVEHYKISEGDDLWQVSQRYGVQMKQLEKYNDLETSQKLMTGTLLWLKGNKPDATVFLSADILELDDEEFEWGDGPEKTLRSMEEVQPQVKADPKVNLPVAPGPAAVNRNGADTTSTEIIHQVVKGDTYYSISKQYAVGVMDLLTWNKLSVHDGLSPGQTLKVKIPQKNTPLADTTVTNSRLIIHEVQPSDSLYSVARKYGVTIKDLMEWNEKKDLTLSVGEKLKVMHK